ncbi:MAG: ABC transporter ATP-binding protein [Verrucomicrobiales bacterium]
MITVKNLTVRLDNFVLERANLIVPQSGYAVLMGKTGCGKTTLIECICGLKRVQSGSIFFGDHDVTGLRPAERGVGYVPQDGALFSTMKVRDQLAFGPRVRGWNKRDAFDRAGELAEELGIEHLMNRIPKGLSGGELQRIALGRALSCRPQVLCLDEPLSALDDETREEICELIMRLRCNHPFTALHITHSRAEAERLGDLVFIIDDDGRVRGGD